MRKGRKGKRQRKTEVVVKEEKEAVSIEGQEGKKDERKRGEGREKGEEGRRKER